MHREDLTNHIEETTQKLLSGMNGVDQSCSTTATTTEKLSSLTPNQFLRLTGEFSLKFLIICLKFRQKHLEINFCEFNRQKQGIKIINMKYYGWRSSFPFPHTFTVSNRKFYGSLPRKNGSGDITCNSAWSNFQNYCIIFWAGNYAESHSYIRLLYRS